MRTPTTPSGLRKYDHLDPLDAALRAWTTPGNHPAWQERTKNEVRECMPVLARALDRAAREKEKR